MLRYGDWTLYSIIIHLYKKTSAVLFTLCSISNPPPSHDFRCTTIRFIKVSFLKQLKVAQTSHWWRLVITQMGKISDQSLQQSRFFCHLKPLISSFDFTILPIKHGQKWLISASKVMQNGQNWKHIMTEPKCYSYLTEVMFGCYEHLIFLHN